MTHGYILTMCIHVVHAIKAKMMAVQQCTVKTVAQMSFKTAAFTDTTRSIAFISGHWRWLSTLIVHSTVTEQVNCLTLRQRCFVYLMCALWLCPVVVNQVIYTQVMYEVFADEMCDGSSVVLHKLLHCYIIIASSLSCHYDGPHCRISYVSWY